MKPKLARALLVLTVFTLLGVITATEWRVATAVRATLQPPPSGAQQAGTSPSPTVVNARDAATTPSGTIFLGEFRFYLAWALLAPGIFDLARRFPLPGPGRLRALAVHLLVPVAGAIPFFWFRRLLAAVFAGSMPTWNLIANIRWREAFILQTTAAVPTYWLLVALGTIVLVTKNHAAQEAREMELQRSLAAAQLDALKFQLQPHVLFNTLNAIASLAQAGNVDAAGTVVERLGTLLRLSMETSGRQLVTLDEELELVDAYLAIEDVRLGDRLRIVRRIDPDVHRALVPNLILQPLVENALVHGLAGRLDATLLEVAAWREGASLRVAVRDDGPGLPADWTLERNAGAGLRNVVDRLDGLYAGQCGFELQNGAAGGAVALLSVPLADARTTAMAAEWQP